MLLISVFVAALTGIAPDALTKAIDNYHRVESYSVTIRSSGENGAQNIRYYYKKPGFVRMEFIHPHEGAVLIYSPDTRRVRVWPFGINHFPELNLSPDNLLIRGSGGQQVDRSDIGALFMNIRTLATGGTSEIVREEYVSGRTDLYMVVTGADKFVVGGVHRYELWLDTGNQFPVKVISHDQYNTIIETVIMEAPEVNAQLPDRLFNP